MGIGERLKSVRGEHTQKEFARLLGLHMNVYARYEREERQMDAELIAKLCREFNVNAQWLLLGEGEMRPGEVVCSGQASTSMAYIDPAVQLVDEAIQETGIRLNDRQKEAVIAIIREEIKSSKRAAVDIIAALKRNKEEK